MTASSEYRDLARWLLDDEMAGAADADTSAVAAAGQRVCRRLYQGLAPLVTTAGSQAFLARALHLARADFPYLDGVQAGASADTGLDGVDQALREVERSAALDGLAEVFAQMIALLVTFIGEPLTLHVLRASWPDVQLRQTASEEAQPS